MQICKPMIGALVAAACVPAAAGAHGASLCRADEKVLFSCGVQGSEKVAALCGSRGVTHDDGYIQYRFGRPGKVELEFPTGTKYTQQRFRYAHYSRFRVDRMEVTFDVNKHSYTVFDSFEGAGDTAERTLGVSITLPTKEKRVLLCGAPAVGSLAELESIAICDKNSPLNMNGCLEK